MKKTLTIGFIKSEKIEEKRIALLPQDLVNVKYRDNLYFEKGYAKDFHIPDEEYEQAGCHVVDRKTALSKDIICDTKIGEATYLKDLDEEKTLFGWIHAGADKTLTNLLRKRRHTCYAWEDMYENHRHLFWKNNQIAGAGGVFSALQHTGWMPYAKKAAIIGRGDVAFGAFQMLSNLGSDVRMYNRNQEILFKKEAINMDIIVIAVRWNSLRIDHILDDDILEKLKKDAIIIDISADSNGAVQSSITTDILHPVYFLHHTMIYSVNNIPSIFYKTATQDISHNISHFIDALILQEDNDILCNCKIIHDGRVLDQHIIDIQQ